jgi:hypothetical protein
MRKKALVDKAIENGFIVEEKDERIRIKGKRKDVTIWPNGKATRNDIDYTSVKYMTITETDQYLFN